MLFCRDIKICRNLRTSVEDFGQKSVFWGGVVGGVGSKTAFLGKEVHYYTVYCMNSKYAPDENLYLAIFALAERLPSSATLLGSNSSGFSRS